MTDKLRLQNGMRIHYRIDGPVGADWIILSNSLATDMRLWDAEVKYLSQTMRVLRYDTRGHGQSDASPSPYGFDLLCSDVTALMDHLEIEKADFMGISLGGMIALQMGLRFPERINRILCCDARADAPAPYKAIWDGNIARLHSEGLAALCEPTLQRWFTAPFLADANTQTKLDTVREMFNATLPDGYEGVARCLQSLDMLGDLPKLKQPVLFITGAGDMAAPIAVMQAMSDATANSRFEVIEDAAHLSNLEQPAAFKAITSDFLGLSA